MTFGVIWSAYAERHLARLWVDTTTRQAITAAANRIDSQLAESPLTVGESRNGGRRILLDAPLGVIYSVNVRMQTVFVIDVWRYSHSD
jgi:plasmid stabilization system protein ParE